MPDETPAEVFIGGYTMAHGADAAAMRIHYGQDTDTRILFLDRDGKLAIRIDLKDNAATLERNRQGLLRLAEVATQLAGEIAQAQQ